MKKQGIRNQNKEITGRILIREINFYQFPG